MDANVQRNIERVNLRLKPLLNEYAAEKKDKFKSYKIIDADSNEVSLEDLDFSKSLIFICKDDFLSYISYYGLLKVNNIIFPDTTLSGTYSTIKKSYMIVDSQDIRFSKIPLDSFYDLNRDGKLPESWNSINFVKKDICLWRLVSSVGIGDNEKMYEGCYSWIEERFRQGKSNWIFYIGNITTFKKEYASITTLPIPIYQILPNGTKQAKTKTTKVAKQATSSTEIF